MGARKKRANSPPPDDPLEGTSTQHDNTAPEEEKPKEPKIPTFKSPSFQQSKNSNKKRVWKSLKQIIAQEKPIYQAKKIPHYSTIDAPPSFRPHKKYSDITGLPAKYTDPQTKLRYANSEEFQTIRSLPMDITAGYLNLRGAMPNI